MATFIILSDLENKLQQALQEIGLEVVRICPATSSGGLRIIIHKPGGVSISDCERATEAARRLLEAQNESCCIEVSSPGLDEPLRSMKDFMRRQGEEVTLYLLRPVSGRLQMEGKIIEVTEESVILEVKGVRVSLPLEDISVGKLMIKI